MSGISQNAGEEKTRQEKGWRDVVRARENRRREEKQCCEITQRSRENYGYHTNLVTDFYAA